VKGHSYTSLVIRGRVMPIMVQSGRAVRGGGGGGGSAFGVALLPRKAKGKGDGGFINSLLMMMRFQEGISTRRGGYVGERVSLHGLICEIWLMGLMLLYDIW